MKKRLALTLALFAALCASAFAQAQSPQAQGPQGGVGDEKRRDIIRLLDLTKAADLGAQSVHEMMGNMRASLLMLPEEQREKVLKTLEEEMSKEFSRDRVIETFVPIYDRHLTGEEVKGLIAFYETPLGRKLVGVMPAIMRESLEEGTRLGRAAGMRAMSRIAEEGLLNPPEPAPAPKPKPKPKPRARRGRA
jgi:uncharacterized protein